ncbi:MAG: peptidoglycan-binding protein [Acidobacteriota bacterium]|nr:peptidoglycan-binding protein [Acidobacteriota bacterium]MDH3529481.1 peptidoglycan-binding protein [Acidobacteriota bacterium]
MSNQIIRNGARGPEVVELQTLLNSRSLPSPNLTTDGKFGPLTRRAVVAFQNANWLVPDGEVGPCTWATLRQTEQYAILHPVTLVPQHDPTACWLAATAMLLRQSIPRSSVPASLLTADGGLLNDSELNEPTHTAAYARHFNLRMHPPQSWTATGLANVIRRGPVATHILWNVMAYVAGNASSGHFAVIAGIRGDGTAIGTTLRIYDPWPVNRGDVRSFGYAKLVGRVPALTYQLFQR